MKLAMINTVFAQESLDAATEQWRVVADQLRDKFPRLAALLDRSESDVLAFMSFPRHTASRSTRPIRSSGSHRSVKARLPIRNVPNSTLDETRFVEYWRHSLTSAPFNR